MILRKLKGNTNYCVTWLYTFCENVINKGIKDACSTVDIFNGYLYLF